MCSLYSYCSSGAGSQEGGVTEMELREGEGVLDEEMEHYRRVQQRT